MQKPNQPFFSILLVALVVTISIVFAQNGIPAIPKKVDQTSLYDYAALLSTSEFNALEQKLIQYNDTTSTQIVVATVKTINGKNIALYATEWAHKWGIGDKGKDNGVFLLVAKDDRKLTIRTGYGVEHKLTDAYSRRIIEQVITPEFKQEKFYKGLDKGTTYIMSALNGEFQGTPQHENSGGGIPIVFIILFFVILIIILSNRNKGNRGRGYRRNTGSILETIILSNSGRGGFGGGGFGGSSGGGFGSGGFGGGFGGGGFGGGGASGGW